MELADVITKIVIPVGGTLITIGLAFLGYFMTRLNRDNQDMRSSIRHVNDEADKNRSEIHRVEVKMSSEFAHKTELTELRQEVKSGFAETQRLIMELHRENRS